MVLLDYTIKNKEYQDKFFDFCFPDFIRIQKSSLYMKPIDQGIL